MKKQNFILLKSPYSPSFELHLELSDGTPLVFDCRAPRKLKESGFELVPTGERLGSHEVVTIKKRPESPPEP